MSTRRRYRRRTDRPVVAVRLDLDTEGYTNCKWGGVARCKQGDWIVCNEADTDSVDAEVFAHTYRQVGPGLYLMVTPLWAERAVQDGSIATNEGVSHDKAGATWSSTTLTAATVGHGRRAFRIPPRAGRG